MTLDTLDKQKHYFLACSFGPDSMALFHMLEKAGFSFSVLHVNYHRRGKASNDEEQGLKSYCEQHHIPCLVYDTTGLKVEGNFQAWARKVRYHYFKTVLDQHPESEGVLVAHHQDDVIETYLMQKASKRMAFYYGIEPLTTIEGVKVIRPLLNMTKEDLLLYVTTHNVPYAIDSSNLEDHYIRNRVRHHIVAKLKAQERLDILHDIQQKNAIHAALIKGFASKLLQKNTAKTSLFLNYKEDEFILLMSYFLKSNGIDRMLSKAKLLEIWHTLKSENTPNAMLHQAQGKSVLRVYDEVQVLANSKPQAYHFIIQEPCLIENDILRFDGQNPHNIKRVPLDKYPITIRPAEANDEVYVGSYRKKIRRLYIDWKMPADLRKRWPVFVSSDNRIIFVPRYQKNYVKTGDNSLLLRL